MTQTSPCPKCGSTERIPQARIIDRGHYSGDAGELQVGVARNPDALLFKQQVQTDLYATICGSCGFTELYASNPEALFRAYTAAQRAR